MNHKFLQTVACALSYTAIFTLPAIADQCSYLTKERALTAMARLNIGDTIYQLCEPCGEKTTQPTSIQNLSLEKVDFEDYWQVKINGEGIDLAYVFVDSGIENNFVNLAAIADCPAQQVSPLLPANSIRETTSEELDI